MRRAKRSFSSSASPIGGANVLQGTTPTVGIGWKYPDVHPPKPFERAHLETQGDQSGR